MLLFWEKEGKEEMACKPRQSGLLPMCRVLAVRREITVCAYVLCSLVDIVNR